MHPIQDLFLESFSYVLQFDMHIYMHSYVDKKFYSCKKWVLQCAFRWKKGLSGRVVKLAPIVALDGLDYAAELSMNISKEVGQCGDGVRFKLKWKSP
jgi:hypothetical protein